MYPQGLSGRGRDVFTDLSRLLRTSGTEEGMKVVAGGTCTFRCRGTSEGRTVRVDGTIGLRSGIGRANVIREASAIMLGRGTDEMVATVTVNKNVNNIE